MIDPPTRPGPEVTVLPLETAAPPPEPATPPAPRWRAWLLPLATSAVSMLLGAAVVASVLLVGGWRYQPERQFHVSVILKGDVTDAQKNDVRTILRALPADKNGIQLESKETAYQRYKQMQKTEPRLPDVEAGVLPESFDVVVPTRDFDCKLVKPLYDHPGVSEFAVLMSPLGSRPGAKIAC